MTTTTTTTTVTAAEIAEVDQISAIIAPWNALIRDRERWIVTLTSGREITIRCPPGAAVELEGAGHHTRPAERRQFEQRKDSRSDA